jgi:DNA repair exonuclease SbcCD nuclease subunit
MSVRFIHTSDWQIGMKGSGLGAAGLRVAEERIETVERVLVAAEERGVVLVLACGDLFEHNGVDAETVERVAKIIARHPGISVHAICGNHDIAGPGSVWNRPSLEALGNLVVHREAGPVEVGAELVLHPFPVTSRYSGRDPLVDLGDLRGDSAVHVALAHGHLVTITFGAHEDDIRLPLDPSHVDRSGLDYLALGHWHGLRILPAADGRPRIAYPGTHEQTAYRETDAGRILLVEIPEKGAPPILTPIEVGRLRWERRGFTFAEDTTLDRFRTVLAGDVDLLELEVDGEIPISLYGAWQGLLEEERRRFLDLRVREGALRWRVESSVALDAIEDAALQQVAARLRAEIAATAGDDQAVRREALALFARLVGEVGA